MYLWLACGVAALGGLLFGFDTAVISGAEGMLQQQFHLSPVMHGWIVSSALVGCLCGSAIAGTLSDRFGRKMVLLLAAVLFTLCAIGSAVPLCRGTLSWPAWWAGRASASPRCSRRCTSLKSRRSKLRGGLVTLSQLAITLGVMAAYLFNDALTQLAQRFPGVYGAGVWRWMFVDEVWRGMLLVGVLPALVLFVLLFFVPESPRWLTKQGRSGEAV